MPAIDFWRGKRVLLTGHTGFKGAWLAFWLAEMGAHVWALARPPETTPALHDLLGLPHRIRGIHADINDRSKLDELMAAARPEAVFHLAAQALVRPSYARPVETFATNLLGTVHLLDAVRAVPSVRAVVVVTSDKAYENHERIEGYREGDELGGRDPYSASKATAEIALRAMQRSFFAPYAAGGHGARIASVRAGNVIGGGDWSPDRLLPDIVRGCLGPSGAVLLRNPRSVRPWQHVMEPLAFYLDLAQRLCTAPEGADCTWNIGPDSMDNRAVRDVADAMIAALGRGHVVERPEPGAPHEATLLTLDCSKARTALGWRPRFGFDDTIRLTAAWYAAWQSGADVAALTRAQLDEFSCRPVLAA